MNDRARNAVPVGVSSPHFHLEHLAEGVYAAIASPGGLAYSNAGIVDLGEQTLVFDTFDLPCAAEDLAQAAVQLTGRAPAYVCISHSHGDHWSGNQLFPRAEIIASRTAAARMPGLVAETRRSQEDPAELEAMVRDIQDRLAREADDRQRDVLQAQICRWQSTLAALPTIALKLPSLIFEGRLVFHGTRRTAELVAAGHRHSPGDVYLLLEAERIAFVGDVAFFGQQPFMADSDPAAWREILLELEGSGLRKLVPGHGPLGTLADLALERAYMAELETLVGQVVKRGGSAEEALQVPLPEAFAGWLPSGLRFERNVRFLHDRLSH